MPDLCREDDEGVIGAATWTAYVTAHVRVVAPSGELEVRPAPPGHVRGHFPVAVSRTVHVVTAHNPGGRVRSDDANRREHERLRQAVDELGIERWPAAGGDPGWRHVEESLALLGLDDEAACALAARFDQDAIFCWRASELVVLACSDGRRSVSGWTAMAV